MRIKSLYLPENSIQNDEFPAHITWDKNDEIEVILTMPCNIEIKEIFNVVPNSAEYTAEYKIKINQFEINGYVGFVFKSKEIMEKAKSVEEIEFYIRNIKSLEEKVFTKKIELFRPSIELVKVPSKIEVEYNENLKCFEFKDKVHIRNSGSGTAYISIELVSDRDFMVTIPEEGDNFIKKITVGLENELKELINQYPNYSKEINNFRSMMKESPILNDDTVIKLREIESELSSLFEADEQFLEDFCLAYFNVYAKNIQLLTQIEGFINYLNSIGNNKIIIYNSMNIIKSYNSTGNLELLIYITDLNYNKYPVIKIPPIPVSCKTQFQISVYSLFAWKDDFKKGENDVTVDCFC